ncbi:FG-GAP-like repeat-containing protein [Streptomyces sp. NPDC057193]|uniref:FG-GAP-like repeat-containing protein n=1 Tax=Streptomyces sp. NPDC057193 TaxID=3346043 RepID=UPI0036451226
MDASTPPENTGQISAGDEPAGSATASAAGKRRRFAVLSAVLAAAVVLPLAVHASKDTAEPAPRAARKEPRPQPLTAVEAIREAKRTGKDVEITADRTANSTTWAQADGWMRTRTYSDTIRAKVGGEWKKIDTRLKRVEGGYAPVAVNDPLLFSAGTVASVDQQRASRALRRVAWPAVTAADDDRAWSELVRLTVEGHELVVSWPGPLPAPVVDGPRALYENVRPGIDLLLTARDSGYSHVLIVHTPEAAKDPLLADIDYRLASATLAFKMNKDSRAVTAHDSAGEEMAVSPTPYLWDSAGTVRVTDGEPAPTPNPALAGSALALPGLAGPQPGSHDSVVGASLDAEGILSLAASSRFLADADTVYPVFIDPSFKGRKKNWTLLYEKAPSSSFYNGQNFNDGTNEARVGYEATTGGLSRSVFNFEHSSSLFGAVIRESYLRLRQSYSWSCSARQYNLYLTGTVTSAHTWNNQPSWGRYLGYESNGFGYRAGTAGCADSWVRTDIKSLSQEAATGRWGGIGIGLRAANESDENAWKKFDANGENSPYIETIYNHPPSEPRQSEMKMTPGGTCDTTAPYPSIGKTDVSFRVTGRDIDKTVPKVHLKVWPTGDMEHPVIDWVYTPASDGVIAVPVPWGEFTTGKTYSWTARTVDGDGATSAFGPPGTSAYCQFIVDQTAPASPDITSVVFPEPGDDKNIWSTVEFGLTGNFTFATSPKDTGVVKYEYSLNTNNHTINPALTTTQGAAYTKSLKPPMAGVNTLYAWAVDAAGNRSQPAKYVFFVTPRKVADPPGDLNGDPTPDLLAIADDGRLRNYPAEPGGDVNTYMPAAYNYLGPMGDGYWVDSTGKKPALITHSGDGYPGDGINEIIARMPDGKLYLYPGDGYGTFNVDDRLEILLPPGSPAPSTLTEIAATTDITGDGLSDMFAIAGGQLWAFTGYTGASFSSAKLLAPSGWDARDLVTVADITGDKVADLLFRTELAEFGLALRQGKPATGGGVDLNSLAYGANSATGKDEIYGSTGWTSASMPMIKGTPDANNDGIPDLWATKTDGTLRFYQGGRATHGPSTLVGEGGWHTTILTLG